MFYVDVSTRVVVSLPPALGGERIHRHETVTPLYPLTLKQVAGLVADLAGKQPRSWEVSGITEGGRWFFNIYAAHIEGSVEWRYVLTLHWGKKEPDRWGAFNQWNRGRRVGLTSASMDRLVAAIESAFGEEGG